MDKREVSVIIPIYNKEKYLRRCVDSVLAQTFQNLEMILVDDESTDQSGVIADEYAMRNNRIRVIHQKNKGEIGARRTGVEAATSQYIIFIDADDSFPRDAIKNFILIVRLISSILFLGHIEGLNRKENFWFFTLFRGSSREMNLRHI